MSRILRTLVFSSGMNKVSQQWRRPQWQPPDASCSYTSCCPAGYRSHGAAGHRPASEQNYRPGNYLPYGYGGSPDSIFQSIVGADASPVFTGKIAVGQLFLNALFRAAPQGHGDILHPAHGDAGQVHLNECFLNAAFTTAISLNGGSLKGNSLELGYFECDISGSSGEVAAVVAAAVARALLISSYRGFSDSASGSSLSGSSTLPHTSSLRCPLITSSLSCTIFSGMVCYLLSNGVSQLHSTGDLQTMSLFIFANLILPALFCLPGKARV